MDENLLPCLRATCCSLFKTMAIATFLATIRVHEVPVTLAGITLGQRLGFSTQLDSLLLISNLYLHNNPTQFSIHQQILITYLINPLNPPRPRPPSIPPNTTPPSSPPSTSSDKSAPYPTTPSPSRTYRNPKEHKTPRCLLYSLSTPSPLPSLKHHLPSSTTSPSSLILPYKPSTTSAGSSDFVLQ